MSGSPGVRDETPKNGVQRVRWSEPALLCAMCSAALPVPAATGRPRRWCSAACRSAAHRRRGWYT